MKVNIYNNIKYIVCHHLLPKHGKVKEKAVCYIYIQPGNKGSLLKNKQRVFTFPNYLLPQFAAD